jgi:hypothetical protein
MVKAKALSSGKMAVALNFGLSNGSAKLAARILTGNGTSLSFINHLQ